MPPTLGRYVLEYAQAMGCDEAFIAPHVLAVVASAIGNSRYIRLKGAFAEKPIIWAATIAKPSTLKSPAWECAVRPLHDLQHERLGEWQDAMAAHQEATLRYEAELSTWKKSGAKNGDAPPQRPTEPPCARHVTSDATVEALVSLLTQQPRGILYAVDELAGWLLQLNAYKGGHGGDLQAWLSMHRAAPVTTDRKTGTRVQHVRRAAVSVCGTIQPKMFSRLASGQYLDSGLISRLLVTMPPIQVKRWTEADVKESTVEAYSELLRWLLALEGDLTHDDPRPIYLTLDAEAKGLWVNFFNDFAREQAEATDTLAAALGKLEAYAARFALVFQIVRSVEGTELADQIDGASMIAGIELARWFAHEARRVYAALLTEDDDATERKLVEFIKRHGGSVTPRDVRHLFRGDSDAAERALQKLVDAGFGYWEPCPPGPAGGRPTRRFVRGNRNRQNQNPVNRGENEGFGSGSFGSESHNGHVDPNDLFAEAATDETNGRPINDDDDGGIVL